MNINITVISVVAYNLDSVLHILIVQQVSVFLCSAQKQYYDSILFNYQWLSDENAGHDYSYTCTFYMVFLFPLNTTCGNCISSNTMNHVAFENHADMALTMKHDGF